MSLYLEKKIHFSKAYISIPHMNTISKHKGTKDLKQKNVLEENPEALFRNRAPS